jgi:deoxyribodipyrimidine photolyase-like uncharacterized protein
VRALVKIIEEAGIQTMDRINPQHLIWPVDKSQAQDLLDYFEHHRALPDFSWTGQTRMHCLRKAIDQSLEHAYAHHIQRLMVTGNFALLTGGGPGGRGKMVSGIFWTATDSFSSVMREWV